MEAVSTVNAQERVHELFQTHEQASAFPDHVYSDHLPIFVEVPIPREQPLKIISWNVLMPNGPSGLHEGGWEAPGEGPDSPVRQNRVKRNIESLKRMVEKHQPDVITLQEAPAEYYHRVLSEFPGYAIQIGKDSLITLYRSKTLGGRLELKEYENDDDVMFKGVSMNCRQTFVFKLNGRRHVRIDNIHGRFSPTPQYHEGYFRARLNQAVPRKGTINVVVGDTNSRVAPEDRTPQNIVTGVIPSRFNQQSGADRATQMTDFPDAAFARGDDKTIRQLPRRILNPATGEFFVPAEVLPDLKPKWHESRMIMCLTDFNRPEDLIEGRNVFEYEAHLDRYFPHSGILVRLGAKDNNARDFGFQFSVNSAIYKHISKTLGEEFNRHVPNGIEQVLLPHDEAIIFVHPNRMSEFLEVINPVIQALQSIDARIESLRSSWKNPFLSSGQPKIDRLNTLRAKILAEIGEKSVDQITSEWESEGNTAAIMAAKRLRFTGTFFTGAAPETPKLVAELKNSPRRPE